MTQLDLFADSQASELEDRLQQFLGPVIPVLWDWQFGTGPRRGDLLQYLACPYCKAACATEFDLSLNHGVELYRPDIIPTRLNGRPWCRFRSDREHPALWGWANDPLGINRDYQPVWTPDGGFVAGYCEWESLQLTGVLWLRQIVTSPGRPYLKLSKTRTQGAQS